MFIAFDVQLTSPLLAQDAKKHGKQLLVRGSIIACMIAVKNNMAWVNASFNQNKTVGTDRTVATITNE
jgi:hypothetical protein